jgi:hypothetical protein
MEALCTPRQSLKMHECNTKLVLRNKVFRIETASYSRHKTVVSVSSWNKVMLLDPFALTSESFLSVYHLMAVLLNYC